MEAPVAILSPISLGKDTTTAMATLMKPLRDKWAELEIASLDKSRLIRALLKTVAPKHNPIAQAAPTPQPNGQTVPATIVGANTAVKQPAVSSYAVPSTVTVQEQELSVANTTAAETGSQISPQSIPVVNQDHPLREEYEDVVLPDLRRMIHKYFSTDGFQRIQIDPLTSSSPQKLTILIHCPSPRNMRRAVKRTRCIDKQKFEVKYKRGEKLRSTAGAGNMENQPIGLNISGNPIYAFLHDELLGTALIGGLVQIQGESGGHFETTVFHFLTETQGTHQPTDSDMILEIAVDGTTSSIASETSSSTSSFSVLGSEDQPEESIYLDNFSFRDIQLRTHAEPAIQIEPLPGDSEKKQLQKSIHAVSGVRVSKIPFSQGSRKSSRALRCIMDWTLISVENGPLSPTTYIRDGNDGPVTMTITSTTSPGGRAVDILVEGRVYCQGRTAGLPSLLPLHSKPEFGLAFMVSTDHKLRKRASFLKYYSDSRADEEQMSTEEGMSGAWIVDSDTAELVGHLIAVSTSSPWGYFIPIMETIEDMKATLNASNVRPPQEGMVEAHLPAGPIEHSHSISNEIRESRGDPRPSRRDSTYTEPGNRGRMVVVDEGSQAAVISARDSVPLGSREPARSLRYPMSSRIPQPQDRPEPIVTANPHIDPVDVFNEGGIHPYFLPARSLFIGRLRHVHTAVALTLKRKFGPIWIYLSQLMIKLGFEMFAGAITAIVVAMKLHTTSPVGHIGVLSGTFRWLVVDMLPPLLCFLTMIIQVFILGRGGNHRFVYLIIITLCLAAYPLVVLVGTLSFYRGIVSELLSLQTQIDRESFLLVGWAVAGLPAIGVLCYVLYSRTRGIPPRGLLAGGRYASMWAMNNLESGYVIGEATTGAILGSFLWISGEFIAPRDAAAAGAVYGTIVLGKMLICSIVRGVYEVRAQLEAVFSESTVFPEDIIIVVPWWWWPWMPLTDIHVPPTDIPVPPRHILPDPDLSRARASQMYRLITLQRRYWLLRQLIGSRNIMVLNSGRIMIHYAPPPLWIRFLLRITIIQKPRRWVQGDRGLLTSTVPVPKDLEKNEIAEASTYPEFERYELVAEASTDPNRNEDAEISIASDIAVAGDSIDLETNRPKPPQTFKRTGPYFMRTPQFW